MATEPARPYGCVADLLALLTNVPADWRRCPCRACNPLPPDSKMASANDKEIDL